MAGAGWTRSGARERLHGCDLELKACGGEPRSRRPTPSALARFYSDLLGWPIVHEEPGTAILAAPQGQSTSSSSRLTATVPPVWPPVDGSQRPMMHFDFQVGDLDSAVAEAVELGATLATSQPQENVRVLLDPAGHPFCLVLDQD